jgi:hypothetical protein
MNTNVNPKLLEKYTELAKADFITEQELENIRSFLNTKLRHNRNLHIEIVNHFTPKKLDDSHMQKGLNWLRKQNITPSGKQSKNSFLYQFEMKILRDSGAIMEVYYLLDTSYRCEGQYVAVYKVIDTAGNWFSYHDKTVLGIGC